MKRFRYVIDPLFVFGCAAYVINRWLIKPHVHAAFFHNWFNDVLLIPCALPPLLLLHRKLGWRTHDLAPSFIEVTAHVIGWSILFELIGPFIMHTTGDRWDVVAYLSGAVFAFLWWHRRELLPARA